MIDKFEVVIRKKEGVVWQGEVESLSSTNEIGPFDILAQHSNFVALIEKYLIIRNGNMKQEWPIDRGILTVKNNIVEAYLGY